MIAIALDKGVSRSQYEGRIVMTLKPKLLLTCVMAVIVASDSHAAGPLRRLFHRGHCSTSTRTTACQFPASTQYTPPAPPQAAFGSPVRAASYHQPVVFTGPVTATVRAGVSQCVNGICPK